MTQGIDEALEGVTNGSMHFVVSRPQPEKAEIRFSKAVAGRRLQAIATWYRIFKMADYTDDQIYEIARSRRPKMTRDKWNDLATRALLTHR
jgi:hypothetical protein